MSSYSYTQVVHASKLRSELIASGLPPPTVVRSIGPDVYIDFVDDLSTEQQATLGAAVAAHIPVTTVESLAAYMRDRVYPFVNSLIYGFAAENIALGVIPAGKSGHILAIFTKQYPIPNEFYKTSLKSSLDIGALHNAQDIIQHIRNNPAEYDGLSPFITDARLAEVSSKISEFLSS